MKNKILLLVCLLGMNVPMIGQTIKSSIHPIQYKQYDKVEIDIELVQKFNNPYVQEEIALDMLITTPSQKEQILPCYFVSKKSNNLSCWKARYTPQESGIYQYKIQLIKSGIKKDTSRVERFEVNKSAEPGFCIQSLIGY